MHRSFSISLSLLNRSSIVFCHRMSHRIGRGRLGFVDLHHLFPYSTALPNFKPSTISDSPSFPRRDEQNQNHPQSQNPPMTELVERWKVFPYSSAVPTEEYNWQSLLSTYAKLSKLKLSALVVASTIFGYGMAPIIHSSSDLLNSIPLSSSSPFITQSDTWWSSLSSVSFSGIFPATFLFTDYRLINFAATVIGTSLCVCSANAFNQLMEVPYDCQMKRTHNRVLPRYSISLFHAFVFALGCGISGFLILYYNVNPCAAVLGGSNILLYALVYTPLKRITTWNTWVGAVVGAIPPLIGYAASSGSLDSRSAILAAVLFCWQFPHFNALSFHIKNQYAMAGYRMMSVMDPLANARACLTYSIWLCPLTCLCAAPSIKLTSPWFLLDGNILNAIMIYKALQFYDSNCPKSARRLFLFSLIHLPCFMILMILHRPEYDWNFLYWLTYPFSSINNNLTTTELES